MDSNCLLCKWAVTAFGFGEEEDDEEENKEEEEFMWPNK